MTAETPPDFNAPQPPWPGGDTRLADKGRSEDPVQLALNRIRGGEGRQCTSTANNGQRCGQWAMIGGTICHLHGGKAPQVIAAAKRRLVTMVEPAIAVLLNILTGPAVCAVCGRSDDMKSMLKAAQLVLDRAGLGPKSTVEVETPDASNSYLPFMPPDRVATIRAWIAEAKAVRDARDVTT